QLTCHDRLHIVAVTLAPPNVTRPARNQGLESSVPESRRRKKKDARPAGRATAVAPGRRQNTPSPPWFGGTLLGLFVVGIAWLLTYYFSNGDAFTWSHLGNWNLAIGFGFVVAGLGLATQWK
ncbi:MAG: putative rane protein, partial [Mycobacterium sp.]|nr:putative rane protein [Mycobacterium sp.]